MKINNPHIEISREDEKVIPILLAIFSGIAVFGVAVTEVIVYVAG